MKYTKLFVIYSVAALFLISCEANKQSTEDKLEAKIDSVLQLMTLDEKIGQLNQLKGKYSTEYLRTGFGYQR